MFERVRSWVSWQTLPMEMKQLAGDSISQTFLENMLAGTQAGGSASPRGAKELLDAYTKAPWLRAAVHKISLAVGMTTWTLHVANRNGDPTPIRATKFQYGTRDIRHRLMKQTEGIEVKEILDHPLLTILNSGSTVLPGTTDMRMAQMYLDLVGEGIQLKERGQLKNTQTQRNMVVGLVNIPPHWVRSLPTPKSPFYGIQFPRTGTVEEVPSEDVIYYKDPNPLDPFGRGSGTAHVLSDELQANEAASRTIRSRLENNAIPPFIAMPEKGSDAPGRAQVERAREDWQRRLRGPTKSGFVHFLMSRFKFEKMGNTFEELSLIPLLNNQRDTIIQVYGIPPEILGILTSSNRSTIDAAEFIFGKFVLMPRLEYLRAVLQQVLVPEYDDRLILDYESPIAGDKAHELNVLKAAPWAFKANEIRKKAGEASLGDEGEVHAVPINIFLEPSLAEAANREPVVSTPAPVVEPEPDDDNKLLIDETSITDYFEMAVLKTEEDDAREVSNQGTKEEDLRKPTESTVREGILAGGAARLKELGLDLVFDINDPVVLEILGKFAGQQIKFINDVTLAALRATLAAGFTAGEDINLLARRIRNVFADAKGRRSVTIARTESIRALNAGQLAATRQAGFEGKQWLSTRDNQVRETHDGLDGQIRPVGLDFLSPSGAMGPHPGALGSAKEDINCRCTIISVAKIEASGDDIIWGQGLDTEDKRVRYWKANERLRRVLEKQLIRAFNKGFSVQEERTLAFLALWMSRSGQE